MAGTKELKTRIRSIGSTRKITRAMQLVSAAKMRKAQNAVLNSRAYSELAWELIRSVIPQSWSETENLSENLSLGNSKPKAELTKLLRYYPDAKKIGIVLLTSNRGLVGSLNTNLSQKLIEISGDKEIIAEIISYGKKGQMLAARLKKNIVADFPKIDRTLSIDDIYPLAKFITEAYTTGQYKKIMIVYNYFISTLIQKPMVKQLLPFVPIPARTDSLSVNNTEDFSLPSDRSDLLIFEPSPQVVVEHLIPRIIESQIYEAILESDASEHSARMVMMKNATEAAGDLISDLTLTYNQLRQNKITTELAEITAGKIALE